ncbi:hypothetical protein [Phenylobacterium sp.]|uniref:hypothetical protein n=1 Tax=Phenylobacterium sp. TaxID=1871053 RepID=UPI002737C3AB|nr:hypothetical protein [Phenylobacterium sp.]MDP3869463.1 hypothetical protein [Phenylobacterium sp.]
MKKQLIVAAAAAPLIIALSAGVAFARGKGSPPAAAVANAANAGINLLNTVISNAGKGNGAEVVVASVDTSAVTRDVVTTSTDTVTGTPSTTTATDANVLSETIVPNTTFIVNPNANSRQWVYKAQVDVVTETTTTTTTTTPVTTNTYTETDTFTDTTVTTTFDELDPGKSQPVNNSPEAGAPAPTAVTTTELTSDGAPELTDSSTTTLMGASTDTATSTSTETKVIATPAA